MIERIHTSLALTLTLAACSTASRSTHTTNERADGALAEARAEIMPLFERMQTTANAHDVDGHLAAYARDSTLLFVINDQIIRGFTALREQQREWWKGGTSDVVYRVAGDPEFQMPAPGLVVQTYLLSSHRTLADGTTRDGRLAVTDIWQKRPEGWRIIYAHESTGSAPGAAGNSVGVGGDRARVRASRSSTCECQRCAASSAYRRRAHRLETKSCIPPASSVTRNSARTRS